MQGRCPRSVKDLSAALALDPGTLSPLLKRLEAAGLITRRRDPSDERVLAVTLTEAGQQLRSEAEKVPPAIVARLGIDIGELEQMQAGLTRLIIAARDVPHAERQGIAADGVSAAVS